MDLYSPDVLVIMETRTHPPNLHNTFQMLGFDGLVSQIIGDSREALLYPGNRLW